MSRSRFAFVGKYSMRPMKKGKGGNLLAYFDVVDTKLGLEFRDMRLIEGRQGVFCSSPAREYENDEGETKWVNFWGAAYDAEEGARDEKGMAYMDELSQAAHEEFLRVSKGKAKSRPVADEDEDEEEVAPKKKAASGKSGRGPVKPPRADDEDEDLDDEIEEDEDDDEVEVRRPARPTMAKNKRKMPF
jgi:hypothetical protein